MAADEFVIDVAGRYPDFEALLQGKRNERILFSARFGTGKTYFLKRFFDQHEEKYVAVRLFPVNYSVSSNEDIFRLIKFDILYELLGKHPQTLAPQSLEAAYALVATVSSTPLGGAVLDGITKATAAALPLLNKDAPVPSADQFSAFTAAIGMIEAVRAKVAGYLDTYQQLRAGTTHVAPIETFLASLEQSHLMEIDFITQFIIDSLNALAKERIADGAEPRRKVLIIDDLDRLDPEHLFRLFNIFSAHFDYRKEAGNKFGFDHVVFVGDLANIHSLFAARYGEKTDRSGYLDKFYSTEPYHFDNGEMVAGAMRNVLDTLSLGQGSGVANFLDKHLFRDPLPVESLLREMAFVGGFSLRRAVSLLQRPISFPVRKTPFAWGPGGNVANHEVHGVVVLEILHWLLGDSATLRYALQRAASRESTSEVRAWRNARSVAAPSQTMMLQYMLPIADVTQFTNVVTGKPGPAGINGTYSFVSPNTGATYVYRPKVPQYGDGTFWAQLQTFQEVDVNNRHPADSLGGFDVMLCAFDKLMDLGYFPKA